MLKMSSQLENIISAYKTLSKIPSIAGAKLNNAGNRITAKWSVRNLDKGKSSKYLTSYVLDESFNVLSDSDFGIDVSNELLSAVSPTETFKVLIQEEKNGKDTKKQYLEVWNKNTLAHCVDLTALDLHGDVYADSEFGSLNWAPDESAVAYIAEKKLPKAEPFIKRKVDDKVKNDGSGETAPKKGEEYIYRQDWGEQLVGKHLSVIVVFTLSTETLTILDNLPDTWCPGQIRFTADSKSIVGVAWPTDPPRLGLIFCTNRPSHIFTVAVDGTANSKLSKCGAAVRSPRFNTNGELFWLQRAADGPHHAAHQLVKLTDTANPGVTSTVIDIVQTEVEVTGQDAFHGVFCHSLPANCFSIDGGRIVLSTPQRNEVRSYVFDVEGGGRLVDISIKTNPGSTTVLDVRSDVILATFSNMTTPGQLYVARLPPRGSEADIKWVRVSTPREVPLSVASSSVEYLDLEHSDSEDAVKSFSALYFAPKLDETDKKLPLIVWPHGGPHSNFINVFSLETAFFNMLGMASLQINYRGSTGVGDASVRFLPKRVGDADVKDCKLATDVALQKFKVDAGRLCLFGGSHGGFLVTHLSGQYPDVYKAVVSRNPVIDVASMFNSTDIPDWCAAEAGFQYCEAGALSEEQLLAMRRCSPLAHVHAVRAPTALMLGAGDKRVPHYQGLEYARRLRANGVPTTIYMYEDNHSLSSLPVEMDNLINSAYWFMKHLP